jgi:hypothetical protein
VVDLTSGEGGKVDWPRGPERGAADARRKAPRGRMRATVWAGVCAAAAARGAAGLCPASAAALQDAVWGAQACAAQASAAPCVPQCTALQSAGLFGCNVSVGALSASLGASGVNCSVAPLSAGCAGELGLVLATTCAKALVGGRLVSSAGQLAFCNDSRLTVLTMPDRSLVGESDVDCGGPWCPPCRAAQRCRFPTDCASGYTCQGGQCGPIQQPMIVEPYPYHAFSGAVLVITGLASLGVACYRDRSDRSARLAAERSVEEEARRVELLARKAAQRSKLATGNNLYKSSAPTPGSGSFGAGAGACAALDPASGLGLSMGASGSHALVQLANIEPKQEGGGKKHTSLREVLADDGLRYRFFLFCKSKFATESILFWEAVCEYEGKFLNPAVSSDEIQQCARAIVERFIKDGCDTEVNLAHSCKVDIVRLFEQSDAEGHNLVFQIDSFQEAKDEIFDLLNGNFYAEFAQPQRRHSGQRPKDIDIVVA